jgi:2-polyprenyl-3-methyl-5-hydroxy-6-metoxy-1,4-benzoquinol methylase
VSAAASADTTTLGGTRAGRAAGYETERPDLQRHIPRAARRILDLGCCTGTLGAALKRRQDATVVGVELDAAYAAEARARLDRVVVSDVELFLKGPPPGEAPFDCLIAADILEHLVDPWQALARAADLLVPGATVVVSLPNIAYYGAVWRLVRGGRWPLEEVGVFDRTHLRWFTLDDGLAMLCEAGLRPIAIDPRYWTSGWHLRWRRTLARTFLHRFLAPQYVFRAVKDATSGDVERRD